MGANGILSPGIGCCQKKRKKGPAATIGRSLPRTVERKKAAAAKALSVQKSNNGTPFAACYFFTFQAAALTSACSLCNETSAIMSTVPPFQ